MAAAVEIVGSVQKVIFQKDGMVIAALRDGPVVKGSAGQDDLKKDLTYRFFGKPVVHPTYGEQFQFTSFMEDRPHDQYGVMTYLQKMAEGVGMMTAGKLWDAFGSEAVDVLIKEPGRAVEQGCCSARVAERASESLKRNVTDQKTRIDLLDLFGNHGFPGKLIPKLIEKWGVGAPEIVRTDPFRMLLEEMPGCGFKRVDELHHKLGHPQDSPRRQMVCAWNRVQENKDGHTWLREEDVARASSNDIGSALAGYDAVEIAVQEGLLRRHHAGGGIMFVSVPSKSDNEAVIARSVARLLSVPATLWPDAASLSVLTEHQRAKVAAILTRPLAILTGTPGTGKTFAAAQIIKAMLGKLSADEIAVCAPTGKAAVRITKALHEYGVDIEAITVHRQLKIAGTTRDGFRFQHNRKNPLSIKLLVLDEGSMMDTDLQASLFDSLDAGTHVLVVGDPYQLPPVGHGAPLRDLILSEALPSGELTEIRRNSGLIVEACLSIKNGFRYETCDAFDGDQKNFRSLEAADNAAILANLRAVCRKLMEKVKSGEMADFDPIEDLQVLCIVNAQSELGRYALNRLLQQELNPDGQGGDTHPFRTGDKVICLVNGPQAIMTRTPGLSEDLFDAWYPTSEGAKQKYIANGDMGRVLAVSPSRLIVRFNNPNRTVVINLPAAAQRKTDDGKEDESGWGCIDLGFAITTHKSQGSEWPFVILPIDESDRAKRIVSRELLYTGISRAKKKCLLIGRRTVADEWCQTVIMRRRKTFLKERVTAALAKVNREAALAVAEQEPVC